MNKTIIALSLIFSLSLGVACNASPIFPYQTSQAQQLGGVIESDGCTDRIILPSSRSFNLMNDLLKPSGVVLMSAAVLAVDPYIVPIDGVNYVMVKDKQSDDWSEKDLLGYDDPKDSMFTSLKALECDGNSTKITPNELKKAGIRLVKLTSEGTLLVKDKSQDLSLNKIKYIDMLDLKRTANSKNTGIFGHFNVYLNTDDGSKKMTIGYVTFDTHSNLKIMFQ